MKRKFAIALFASLLMTFGLVACKKGGKAGSSGGKLKSQGGSMTKAGVSHKTKGDTFTLTLRFDRMYDGLGRLGKKNKLHPCIGTYDSDKKMAVLFYTPKMKEKMKSLKKGKKYIFQFKLEFATSDADRSQGEIIAVAKP